LDPELEKKGMESYYTQNDSYRLDHCYTGTLAKHYDLTQENLAFPGASLQSMQWNLMWWLNNHNTKYIRNSIIVVGLTDESRISWYNPNHNHTEDDPPWNNYLHAQWLDSSNSNIDQEWFKLHKSYLTMSACDELYKLNYETTAHLFDGIGLKYNIPVIQFNVLSKTKIDVDSFYDFDIRMLVSNNYKQQGHPNEEGHRLIAKKLIERIDTLLK